MTENRGSESLQEFTAHWVLPFMERQKNLRADMLWIVKTSMGSRGVETPVTGDRHRTYAEINCGVIPSWVAVS
jgi:hypothetical protein